MADEQQNPAKASDPLAEYDAKAAAPQRQALPEQDLPANLPGGLVPAEEHETMQHVLPEGLAVSKNNVHLPTGLVYDDDSTGHVTASPEQQKKDQELSFWEKAKLAVAGPTTAFGTPIPEDAVNEASGINDMLHGNFKKGGKKIWDAENILNAKHIIPGSPAEWAIRQFDPDFHGEATAEVRARNANALEKPLVDIAQFIDKDKHPIGKALTEVGQGLTSPENLAIMYGSGGLGLIGKTPQAIKAFGVLNKLISAGFAFQAAESAYQHSAAFKAAMDAGDASGAEYELTHALLSGTMAVQAGSHAVEGEILDPRTGKPFIKTKALPLLSETDKAVLGTIKDATTTAAKSVADFTGKKFSAAADRLGASLGKSSDFNELVTRAANMLGKKAGPEFSGKVKNVEQDLKAILNNDVDNKIVDPKSAAEAIDDHLKTAIDAPLLQEAGATKDSAEPVVPNFRQRLQERLDKFFSDTAGRYASGEQVEKAKERILDRVEMQHDFGNGIAVPRDPNLFEAENIRQGLNSEGAASPFEDSANIESNAYKAAARETAAFMRETIDEAYNAKGVRGVKEARTKEADLIDVRDALRDSQAVADKLAATPSILKLFSLGKMVGMIGAIGAHFASSNFLAGALAAGTLWKHVHETNVRDVVGNLERAKAAAGREPGARATVPQPGGPELQGPAPAPLTPPVIPPPTAPEGFPPPPQPPAPVTPPAVNHRLYGALSSYFGEFLGARPYQDLMQEFSNQVADMKQDIKDQGGKYNQDQIDKAAKLQEKINDAHAQEHEYVQKQNAINQAKYEKEKLKYEQKLKAELAKQETQRKTEAQQKSDQVKASLLTDERIAHSPVLKATEEPLPIEGIEGRSSEQNHAHEHGHIMAASAEGLEPSQFVSDQHPDALEDGAAAQVHIDTSMAEKGPKGIAQKVVAILGGPAFDEVHHDIKLGRNTGARDDIARARQLLREDGGLRGAALEKVFDALYDRAKEHVSNPEALAIAQANMRVREAGLHPNYHMSAGRMAEYVKKLQGAYGNGKTQSTEVLREGDAGRGDEEGESDLAGGAAEKQAGAAEGVRAEALREGDEGGGQRKPGGLAKAALKSSDVIEAATKHYGLTDEPQKMGYILPTGKGLDFSDGQKSRVLDHGDISEVMPTPRGENPRERFVRDTGAARILQSSFGTEVVLPATGATPEQIETITRAVEKHPRGKKELSVDILISPEQFDKVADTPGARGTAGSARADVTDAESVERVVRDAKRDAASRSTEKAALKSGVAEEEPEIERLRRAPPREAFPETVAEHANAFNKTTGRPPVNAEPIQHSPETASRIARAYEKMPHNPADPAVQKAYGAMKNDLDAQWDYATDQMGIQFEPWKRSGQPYADSKEMIADVKNNKHLYFFQGGELPADHPMADIDPKTGFSYNDKLRAVHDLFGHAAHGFQFGPKGEENAWNVHRQMFSPEAVPAITTETRGQNSWVNFGEHLRNAEGKIPAKGESGYIPPAERPYAQNKAGLLPEEFHGPKGPEPESLRLNLKASPKDQASVDKAEWEDNPTTGYRKLVVKDENGKEIGRISHDNYRIRLSSVPDEQVNKGIGKAMYERAFEDAKQNGADKLMSDTSLSPDAARVWDSLAKSGKWNITAEQSSEVNRGKVGNQWDDLHTQYTVHLTEGPKGGKKEWVPPQGLEKGIPRDEAVSTEIPLSKLSVSERQYNQAVSNVSKGAGSRSEGPVSIVYNPDNGQYLVEDGMHRIAQAHQEGKETIPAKVWSGYSDIANVRPEEKMDLSPSDWAENVAGNLEKAPAGGVNPNNPETPSKRYGLELVPEVRKPLGANPTADDFRNYAQQEDVQGHLATHPDIKLGWDTTGEKPELNVGVSTDDKAKALDVAKKLDQRAMWDNQEEKEVPVGGAGKQTSFPDYPVENRLRDLGIEKVSLKKDYPKDEEDKPIWEKLTSEQMSQAIKDSAYATYSLDEVKEGSPWLSEADKQEGKIPALKADHGSEAGFLHPDGSMSMIGDSFLHDVFSKEIGLENTDLVKKAGIGTYDIWRAPHGAGHTGIAFDLAAAPTSEQIQSIAALTKHMREGEPDTFQSVNVEWPGGGKSIEFPTPGKVVQALKSVEKVSLKKSPKGSSVPLMDNPLPVKGTMGGGEVGTLDLTKALNAYSRKQLPALKPGEAEPKEMIERAKNIAEDEAKYQLAQSKTGTEWYTTEMKEHDRVLQGLRPELAEGEMTAGTDKHPVNLTLFKASEAILSSGQKPYANVKSALKAWDLYKETGEFPPINPDTGKSWGPRGPNAYALAFDSLNRLIQEKGEKGAADWLLSEHPIKELRSYQVPSQVPVRGKATDNETGALVLGAKRGPFMQNLHGIESKFTADMWVSRTWNRWMGTLDLEPRIEASGKMTSESDAPRNNTERSLMRESFEKTAQKLKLTPSSLQAVLWYYEQALYRAHGLPVESWSFSDAAKRVASEQSGEEEQTSFPFGESAKGKGLEAGLSRLVRAMPSKFANISGKNIETVSLGK